MKLGDPHPNGGVYVPGLASSGLKELMDAGYTAAGINYSCGCRRQAWFKDGELVKECHEKCEAHRGQEETT